jgi:hypothetical protein
MAILRDLVYSPTAWIFRAVCLHFLHGMCETIYLANSDTSKFTHRPKSLPPSTVDENGCLAHRLPGSDMSRAGPDVSSTSYAPRNGDGLSEREATSRRV